MEQKIKEERKANVILYIGLSIVMMASLLAFYFFYLMIWPVKIIDILDVSTDKKIYKAGEEMKIFVKYCKYQDVIGEHTLEFANDIIIPSSSTVRYLPLGCRTYEYKLIVPSEASIGHYYKVIVKINYQVNQLRNQQYSFETKDILIQEGGEK